MSNIKISELIKRLEEFKNTLGDVPIGIDNGYGISFVTNLRENICYEFDFDNDNEDDEIPFVELMFN